MTSSKEYFQNLYSRLSITHRGVELRRVLCSTLMYIASGKIDSLGSLKSLYKYFASFDISKLRREHFKRTLIVFGFYPNRNDHRQLMENIARRIGPTATYIDTSRWSTRELHLSPCNILRGLYICFISNLGLTLKQRLLLGANITFYLNTIDSLRKVDFSPVSKFLCLANSLDLENLLTQYLQAQGITTYSLMEGAYFVQENDIPITNIAFDNLTSDIQLCWGQFSKDEFIKYGYPEKRLIVAGYPKEVKGKPLKADNSFRKAVVLLSQYIMEPQNRALIGILSKFSDSIEFSIKLHPSLNYEVYSRLATEHRMKIIPKNVTLNDCVDNSSFDFAIAINSTAYYEALMRGLPCLRYFDGSYTPLAGYDDEFSSPEMFRSQYSRIKSLPLSLYQSGVDEALRYAVGWGIDRYHQLLG